MATYRLALKEQSREWVPFYWAATQSNLGNALAALGKREAGTARLEEAVTAFDACLTVVVSVWLDEWIQDVRSRRDDAQAEIARHWRAEKHFH